MKNAILLFALLLASTVYSQTKTDNKPEDPKQRKIEKVNKALALTDEETAKFWPLHDNFDSQQENLRLQLKKAQSDLKIAKGKKEFNKAFEDAGTKEDAEDVSPGIDESEDKKSGKNKEKEEK